MPRGGTNKWSRKEERMYEHIKKSERGSGRAKEIAARTVNKHRREHGRTQEQQDARRKGGSLEDRTKAELYEMAKKRGIDGRSKMDKQELIKAVRR